MIDEPNGKNQKRRDDAALESLLREALSGSPVEVEFPAEGDILAYLSGRATERQKSRVQDALARSSAFQRFMMDLNNAIVSSTDTDAAVQAGQIEIPENFIRRVEAEFVRRPGFLERIQVRVREWSQTLIDLLRPKVFVPVAVVPVAIAVVLLLGVSKELPTMTAYDQLLPNYFLQGATRGDEDELGKQPHELAYQAFSTRIRLDDESGEFEVVSGEPAPHHAVGTKMVVRMLDADDNERATFVAKVPAETAGKRPDSVSFWLIAVPSLQVWQYPMDRDSVDLLWSPEFDNLGCGVFTYLKVDDFKATSGITYEIDK